MLKGVRGSNNLLITAPAGRGKTALLVRWIDQLPSSWQVVFVPISIRYQTNQAVTFYQALAVRLAGVLAEAVPEPRTDPTSFYREKVIEYVDRIGESGDSCLIVIDGLDEARGWKIDTAVLPFKSPPTLKIVVSARELAGDRGARDWLDRLGWTPPQSGARALQVPLLSRAGVREVLERMGFPIEDLSASVDIVDELYRLTDHGDPLLLQLYSHDLMDLGRGTRLRPEDLARLAPGFGAYFRRWLEEQRDEWRQSGLSINVDLINAILAVLAIAFGPLKLRDLEALIDRILPGPRTFTVNTMEPLSRFIVGDGVEAGFALTHPKLSVYLQNEYFGQGKIVNEAQRTLRNWMRETVVNLNSALLPASDCPEYVLVFYSQHLSQADGEQCLHEFRDLVENGWRKAWEYYEQGFQGFCRDVDLASRALQKAADEDPGTLRRPRIGLGGLVRCALCLSSIQSIGSGLPGILLAEFLVNGGITAKQALYLASIKDDRNRADAISKILPHLQPDMRSEAYASLREIRSPEERFDALLTAFDYLQPFEQQSCAREILRIFQALGDSILRLQRLDKIREFVPDAIWAELHPPAPRATSYRNTFDFSKHDAARALKREMQQGNLEESRYIQILDKMKDLPAVDMPSILDHITPYITPKITDYALSSIFSHPGGSFSRRWFAEDLAIPDR